MTLGDRETRKLVLLSTALLPRPIRVRLRRGLLERMELARARRAELLIVGHPKSGNTWLRTLLSRLYQRRYGLPANLIVRSDELHRAHPGAPRLHASNGHYSYEGVIGRMLAVDAPPCELHGKPVVLLVRHPCDIVVSWYLQFTKRQSRAKHELIQSFVERPVDVRTISRWEFATHPELGLPHLIDYLNTWERNLSRIPRSTIVRYEDLRSRPVATLQQVVDLLDPDFDRTDLEEAVEFTSFERLQALESAGFFRRGGMARPASSDPETRKVRRGEVGGYRRDFPEEQVAELETLVAARLSPTLGYGAALGSGADGSG